MAVGATATTKHWAGVFCHCFLLFGTGHNNTTRDGLGRSQTGRSRSRSRHDTLRFRKQTRRNSDSGSERDRRYADWSGGDSKRA